MQVVIYKTNIKGVNLLRREFLKLKSKTDYAINKCHKSDNEAINKLICKK